MCRNRLFFTILYLLLSLHGKAQELFNPEKMHVVSMQFDVPAYWDSLEHDYAAFLKNGTTHYLPASVVIDGDTLQEVGARFKGQYSNFGFPGPKKPFKLDFNEFIAGQNYQGLKKVNLHNFAGDPSFLREHISYGLFRQAGVPASRTAYCQLYINGTLWGTYLLVEEIDKTFVKRHFGKDEHVLYECAGNTSMRWENWADSSYSKLFDIEFDSHAAGYEPLKQFINAFNNDQSVDFSAAFNQQFDLQRYFRTLCLDVLLNNWDSYYDNGRNFFLYHDGRTMHWIPWDYNLALWDRPAELIPHDHSAAGYKPLIARIEENPLLRDQYLQVCCEVLNSLQSSQIRQETEHYAALIAPYVALDPHKFYTTADFEQNVHHGVTVNMLRNNQPTDVYLPGITPLAEARLSTLRKAIFRYGYSCEEPSSTDFEISVFPNPAIDAFQFKLWATNEVSGFTWEIVDASGRKIESYTSNAVDVHTFDVRLDQPGSGIYFLKVKYGDQLVMKRICVL